MCLSAREQRLLEQIGEDLGRSDPRLASMLAVFGRCTAGEAMPGREQLRTLASRARAALRAAAAAAATLIVWAAALDPRAWSQHGRGAPAPAGKRPPQPQQARSAAPPARRRNGQQPGQPDPSHP